MVRFTTGIYQIRNKITRKCYVGSAAEIEKRWAVHRCHLRRGSHHSAKLQRSWDKHGEVAFTFRIVEICEVATLTPREQYWIEKKNSYLKGYNCQPNAGSSRGYKLSVDVVEKMREAAIRVGACPEERKRRSIRAKAQHAAGNLGKKTASHRRPQHV